MDELRHACATVATRARSVRIDGAAVPAYAASLPLASKPGGGAGPDDDAGAGLESEARALHWLSLDAINFGSGWFPTLRKPDGRSGYATIATAWGRRLQDEGPLRAEQLTSLEPARLAAILGQDPEHELIELFALSLRDLGARLLSGFGGSALELVHAADGSAVAFARELGGWTCFADRSAYDELSLGFLKRAQIAAADLQRAGVVGWHDAARLTMFADNLVPHVLKLDGVLRFDPDLEARIDAGTLIEHGSREEVEIRACAVHAVELIVAARHAAGDKACTAANVDQLLWHRGRGPRYKARPRHRSRCMAY
jgi:hypothetical protein